MKTRRFGNFGIRIGILAFRSVRIVRAGRRFPPVRAEAMKRIPFESDDDDRRS